jgi:1,4-dihydroxy-6-naphthoate synthase
MAVPAVNFAFSTCPNDTFAFHALVHGLVPGPRVETFLDDIEVLNQRAERGEAAVTKVSMAAYGRLRDRYALLRAGGAAGYGVGPILVARSPRAVGGRIAIPGVRTTAAMLLRLLGAFETVPMRFDRIEDAVLAGEVDCGLLIHEGRFTYQAKGLTLLEDLGSVWEARMRCPLPLAAIAVRRDLAADVAPAMDQALRASVDYAFAHPEASADYVRRHALEMDAEVTARHIALYVNDYTRALDEQAVASFVEWAAREGQVRSVAADLPMFA